MLRAPVVKQANHTATSRLETRNQRLILTQEFIEGDYYCGSAVAIAVAGREVDIKPLDEQTIRLSLKPGRESFTVLIASSASFDRRTDLVAETSKKLAAAAAQGFAALAESNRGWWQRFWEKSLVHLHSPDGVADRLEAGYTYFLYIMASTSQGKFPTKFNGMLWTTGGDRRTWGGQFWGANQSCFYNNALSAANHLELMAPMFDMYSGMFDSCALAARSSGAAVGFSFRRPWPSTVLRLCRKTSPPKCANFICCAAVEQHVAAFPRLRGETTAPLQPLELDGGRTDGGWPVDARRARQRSVWPGDAHFLAWCENRVSVLAAVRIYAGSPLAGRSGLSHAQRSGRVLSQLSERAERGRR